MNYKIGFLLFISVFAFAQQKIYVSANTGNDDSGDGTEQSPYETINRGIQDVVPGGTVYVKEGIYTNQNSDTPSVNFSEDSSRLDSAGRPFIINSGTNLNNPHVVTIDKSGNIESGYITIKNYQNDRPKIIFDGQGGIKLGKDSSNVGVSYVIVEGFEVVGPSSSIDYNKAITNRRYKVTLHEDPENHNDHLDADNNGNREQIIKHNLSYFSGKGIWGGYDSHHHIIIRNNTVHDTPGSGIRFNDSDHVLIENNTVYNTTWWTSSASSAIVFAETIAGVNDNGTDAKMIIRGNTVYNNWNRIPFFMTSLPENGQPPSGGYGDADYSTILDGQGLYVTRSDPNYNGTFLFENNLCVNNGKNGINFDRSNGSSALIRNNTIYFNGVHDLVQDISENIEGNPRHGGQKVAGIKANFVKNVTVVNNIVETRSDIYSALQLPTVTGTRTVNNNIFVLGSISWGAGNQTNNQVDSPQFVNPKSLSDDATTSMEEWENYLDGTDFSLLPSSPAIDAGDQNNAPKTDINSYPRPGNGSYFSSFENSLDGWSVWTNGNDLNQKNTIELSEAYAKTGSKSIISRKRTKDFHSPKYVIDDKLEIGATYSFSVWVKLQSGSNDSTAELKLRKIQEGDSESLSLMNDIPVTINSQSWTKLTTEYTHDEMDSSSFLFVKGPSLIDGVGVDYFIDDFSILPTDYPAIDFNSIADTGTTVDIGAYEYQSQLLSLLENPSQATAVYAYPNPTKDILTLINVIDEESVAVYDVLGRKLAIQQQRNTNSLKLNVSKLDAGIYYINVSNTSDETKSIRFIKK
jgi:parallel beta-helix repeat protein